MWSTSNETTARSRPFSLRTEVSSRVWLPVRDISYVETPPTRRRLRRPSSPILVAIQSCMGVAKEALVSRLCKSTAASTAPPPGRSWSTFQPVAPSLASRRKKATQMRVVEVKKNVDLCSVEVNNSRLQLGDVARVYFHQSSGVGRLPCEHHRISAQQVWDHHSWGRHGCSCGHSRRAVSWRQGYKRWELQTYSYTVCLVC